MTAFRNTMTSINYIDIYDKIVSLQKDGGQRWNLICEDTSNLYFIYVKNIEDQLFDYQELWSFLFNVNTKDSILFKKFKDVFETSEINRTFLSKILYVALDDPPSEWWRQFNDILKN